MFLELTESNFSLQVHAVLCTVRCKVRRGFIRLLSFEFTTDIIPFNHLSIAVSKTQLMRIFSET